MPKETAWYLVGCELSDAQEKFGKFASTHEGWAVLREEVDELWDAVKANDHRQQYREAIQVAAMAIRFLHDCCHVPLADKGQAPIPAPRGSIVP